MMSNVKTWIIQRFKIASVFPIIAFAFLPASFYFTARYIYLKDSVYQSHEGFDCQLSGIIPDLSKEILPDVDILVGMFNDSMRYYEQLLIPSLGYFWPGNLSIVVVLDSKKKNNLKLGNLLAKHYPFPRICFQGPTDPWIYDRLEYRKIQDTFYPEKFTSRKYVGYVHPDTVFVTKVTRQLLFEDNKPVIIGIIDLEDKIWRQSSETAALVFKTRDIIQCVSSFPLIVKVEHIVVLRKYLEAIHSKRFDEITKIFTKGSTTTFTIICQYIWMFHRNDYKFYFNEMKSNGSLISNRENNLQGRRTYTYYNIILTPEQRVPQPKPSISYSFFQNWKGNDTLRKILKTGLCFSGGFDVCVDFCKEVDINSLHESLFRIARSDWTWDERCIQEQRKHYAIIKTSYTDRRSVDAIKAGCRDVEMCISPYQRLI